MLPCVSNEYTEKQEISNILLLGLLHDFLSEMVHEVVIKVLTTQVSVTGSSLDSENTTLNVQKRHIEGTATEIVDEDVPFLVRLSGTKTVGDGGSSRLVNDTENVETSNGTCILGGLALVVVEVGGYGNDSLLDLHAELHLSNLLHLLGVLVAALSWDMLDRVYLDKDHGGNLLRRELLALTEVLNFDERAAALVDDLEWP